MRLIARCRYSPVVSAGRGVRIRRGNTVAFLRLGHDCATVGRGRCACGGRYLNTRALIGSGRNGAGRGVLRRNVTRPANDVETIMAAIRSAAALSNLASSDGTAMLDRAAAASNKNAGICPRGADRVSGRVLTKILISDNGQVISKELLRHGRHAGTVYGVSVRVHAGRTNGSLRRCRRRQHHDGTGREQGGGEEARPTRRR